jgi:hypothetical protein
MPNCPSIYFVLGMHNVRYIHSIEDVLYCIPNCHFFFLLHIQYIERPYYGCFFTDCICVDCHFGGGSPPVSTAFSHRYQQVGYVRTPLFKIQFLTTHESSASAQHQAHIFPLHKNNNRQQQQEQQHAAQGPRPLPPRKFVIGLGGRSSCR